jgi:hypothetical protein
LTHAISYRLDKGPHASREAGMCAMEWVAYLANEPHTDQPVCVSPVLKSFCIAFNDALPDDQRQRLRPYLARCIGTAGDGLDERRAWMATDWIVTVYAPAWLDLAGLHDHAQNLRALAITNATAAKAALPAIREARKAMSAAWAAAGDAASSAAWVAAWAAARAAARAAAWVAAGDAASAAARVAARSAARAAAGDALAPTVTQLQDSAFDLLDRMLPTEAVEIAEPYRAELRRLVAA